MILGYMRWNKGYPLDDFLFYVLCFLFSFLLSLDLGEFLLQFNNPSFQHFVV